MVWIWGQHTTTQRTMWDMLASSKGTINHNIHINVRSILAYACVLKCEWKGVIFTSVNFVYTPGVCLSWKTCICVRVWVRVKCIDLNNTCALMVDHRYAVCTATHIHTVQCARCPCIHVYAVRVQQNIRMHIAHCIAAIHNTQHTNNEQG